MPESNEISRESLRRYMETRRRIDPELKSIYGLTHLLSQFEESERDRVSIDPVALGLVNRSLEQSVLAIQSALDDFLLAQTAERTLRE